MFFSLMCPSTVLIRMCDPSLSTSIHTGVAWGEPSDKIVDKIAT
jgi:hypothetical protein